MDTKKLLLVDDVNLFIQLQISFLGRRNYEIMSANSGEEALVLAREHLPDLIVLDYVMPGLSGAEVCREIKSHPLTRHIPIIIVSSLVEEDVVCRCREAGCDAILYKPVRKEIFVCTVEEKLGILTRRCDRVHTALPCRVHGRSCDAAGTILSLSMNGAFVGLDQLPAPGDLLDVDFHLPEYNNRVLIKARAVWSGERGHDGLSGAGLQFLEPGAVERELIRRHMISASKSRISGSESGNS